MASREALDRHMGTLELHVTSTPTCPRAARKRRLVGRPA